MNTPGTVVECPVPIDAKNALRDDREPFKGLSALLRGALGGDQLLEGWEFAEAGKAVVAGDFLGIGIALVKSQAEVLNGALGISSADTAPGHVIVHGATVLR
jgi:hypothetical protein